MNKKIFFIVFILFLVPAVLSAEQIKVKSATASSVDTVFVPENAIDNDLSTRWGSLTSDPQWLLLELDQVSIIKNITINWEAAYARSYEIQFSEDKDKWRTVYSTENGDGNEDSIDIRQNPAKYIRIYGKQRVNNSWGYSIYEVKVTATGGTNTAIDKLYNDDDLFKEISILSSPFAPGGSDFYRDTLLVRYSLNKEASVSVSVFNLNSAVLVFDKDLGQKSTRQEHEFEWDGRNNSHDYIKNGLYFIQIKAKGSGKEQEFTYVIAAVK